jgi:hypothetical protein
MGTSGVLVRVANGVLVVVTSGKEMMETIGSNVMMVSGLRTRTTNGMEGVVAISGKELIEMQIEVGRPLDAVVQFTVMTSAQQRAVTQTGQLGRTEMILECVLVRVALEVVTQGMWRPIP